MLTLEVTVFCFAKSGYPCITGLLSKQTLDAIDLKKEFFVCPKKAGKGDFKVRLDALLNR